MGNDPKRTRSGTWPTLRDLLHDFRCGKVLALQCWLAALSLPENSSQPCALPNVFQFEQDTLVAWVFSEEETESCHEGSKGESGEGESI